MKTACFAASLRAEFGKQVDENAAAALKNDSRLLTSEREEISEGTDGAATDS